MTNEEYLQECIDRCKVETLDHGHRAVFLGVPGKFEATGGPNSWTREMACKAAIFFWALDRRDEQLEAVEFF